MALELSVVSQFGNIVTYHKIVRTITDWHGKFMQVDMASFVDAKAKTDGCDAVMTKTYYFRGAEISFDTSEDQVAKAYVKIKALPEWDKSKDV